MALLFELFLTFAKIGAFTFGGGYAMLALLDHTCVEKKKWLTAEEFSDLTVIAESTPGPIAINCSTYAGYKKAGLPGAAAATLGMVLPSFIILLLISLFFENILAYPVVSKAFRGIRIAVSLLILQAGFKMAGKMLKTTNTKVSSLLFVAFFFSVSLCLSLFNLHISTIWLILVSGTAGFFLYGLRRKEGAK
ncbi:MAG: chromate transporter [Ruminococcaceae bacterium]|nr:chromate transporter [Oscillospiraceae bacterium]